MLPYSGVGPIHPVPAMVEHQIVSGRVSCTYCRGPAKPRGTALQVGTGTSLHSAAPILVTCDSSLPLRLLNAGRKLTSFWMRRFRKGISDPQQI